METRYKVFITDVADKISLKEKRFELEPELTAKFARFLLVIEEELIVRVKKSLGRMV